VAWYDVSDLSTLFTTSTGTTQVAANDDPVGFVGDKSQGFVAGTELVPSPIDLSDGGVYTTITQLDYPSPNQYESNAVGTINTGPGFILASPGIYEVAIVLSSTSDFSISFRDPDSGTIFDTKTVTQEQTTLRAIGNFTGNEVQIRNLGLTSGIVITVHSWSVRPLPGNHLTQSTATARGLWKTGGFMRADGIDDNYLSSTFAEQAQPNTIAVGFQYVSFGTNPSLVSGTGTKRHNIYAQDSNTSFVANAGSVGTIATRDTDKHVLVVRFDGANSIAWIDGTEVSPLDLGAEAIEAIRFFVNAVGTGNFGNADLYQYVLCGGNLTDSERINLEQFIAGKVGVTL